MMISKLSFARNLNKCIGSINRDYKLEKVPIRDRRKSFRYIILPKSEEYNSNIRISTRKQGSSVAIVSPPPPDPSPPDTPVLGNQNNSNSQNTSLQILNDLRNIQKVDFPFFLARIEQKG